MIKLTIAALAAASALALGTPAAAQLVLEGNGARADGEWGGEVGLGYAIGLAGFRLAPAAGVLVYRSDDDRYRQDANGGSPRCRDTSNGQYASDSECDDAAVKPYGRIEAAYSIPLVATIGGGVRIGADVRPYGTVALPIAPRLNLKGNAGPRYYALGLRLNL